MKTPFPDMQNSSWYYLVISYDLSKLKEYQIEIENFLEEKSSSAVLEKERLETIEDPPFGAVEYWESHFNDIIRDASDIFPQTMRQSLFIATCTLLEGHQKIIANFVKDEEKSSVTLKKERYQSWVEAHHEYIQKVTNLDLTEASKLLVELGHHNQLRNSFVHDMGYLVKNNDALSEWIDQHKHIHLDSKGSILLDKAFCPEHIDLIDEYLELLNTDLANRMKNRTSE